MAVADEDHLFSLPLESRTLRVLYEGELSLETYIIEDKRDLGRGWEGDFVTAFRRFKCAVRVFLLQSFQHP
jgi:hypothetical protein